ncbi:hypothetical protein [Bacteroides nordii]|jgi:uncharacterized protein (DUF1499 family)|uniref:hypothetical protein n=1 Tax=Bacteroides nordii TaxID=291645 RepID=UPI001F305747|nr:hypothetical protein [Bacteroides nordii]MCE8465876.1 hypothetical protein [Bacteroides nordii]UYU49786.1 hypothetical protein KQP55_04025 [Bacteroides nordii]DAZ20211.1 MAG TPA: hypothetical protein [Caudoviricetes sp.]
MRTIESKIKQVVDKIEGLHYLFDNWATANVRLDSDKLPAMLNVLPISGVISLTKNKLKDFPNCLFAFLDKAEFDFDGQGNDITVEKCKSLAKMFILHMNESELFEQIEGDIPYSVVYDKLDVNVTGIVIEIKVKELNGLVLCPGKPISSYFDGEQGGS